MSNSFNATYDATSDAFDSTSDAYDTASDAYDDDHGDDYDDYVSDAFSDDAASDNEAYDNASNACDISVAANACFGNKIATLCLAPPSSWNIRNIVSTALDDISTGPTFSTTQLDEQRAILRRLQLQGYQYPPSGDKVYARIPGWPAFRINNQHTEIQQTVVQDPVSVVGVTNALCY